MINLENKNILVTGAAGFIGANLVQRLLKDYKNIKIIGVDNLNDYYDVNLKRWRLGKIEENDGDNWSFIQGDISDGELVKQIFQNYEIDVVVNLAAQAGVRYSIQNPDAYIASNIIGFYNILEACRHSYDGGKAGVQHLVYASSSSVYGMNKEIPYSTHDNVDKPVSLYAATKKSNELLAHAYSKLYEIPSTGLRFFTVYGPAGRPDMAYFGFTDKLLKGEKINIFNYGNCKRDFTYIDDIVEGIVRVLVCPPSKMKGSDDLPIPPYKIYNIGNSKPEDLMEFVRTLKNALQDVGILPTDFVLEDYMKLLPMQPGDVPITYADTSELERDFGYKPTTTIQDGLRKFAEWYKTFYNL